MPRFDGATFFMPKAIKESDVIGLVFGRITVLSIEKKENNSIFLNCKCKCGRLKVTRLSDLRKGKTQSCGCLNLEILRSRGNGHTDHPDYSVWQNMKSRCDNTNNQDYKDYGERGIEVCERWRHSFDNFIADMGSRPSPKHTIDRVDNDGNYEPSNCRWATRLEQSNNTRSCVILNHNGLSLTLSEWSRRLKINYRTIESRFIRGYCVSDILDPILKGNEYRKKLSKNKR